MRRCGRMNPYEALILKAWLCSDSKRALFGSPRLQGSRPLRRRSYIVLFSGRCLPPRLRRVALWSVPRLIGRVQVHDKTFRDAACCDDWRTACRTWSRCGCRDRLVRGVTKPLDTGYVCCTLHSDCDPSTSSRDYSSDQPVETYVHNDDT